MPKEIPEKPKHFFHWDISNVFIGIFIGIYSPMIISNEIGISTYVVLVLLLVFCMGSWITSARYNTCPPSWKIIFSLVWILGFILLFGYTIHIQNARKIQTLLNQQEEVSEKLTIEMRIPQGEDVFESYANITNNSKIKLLLVKPKLITRYIKCGKIVVGLTVTFDYSDFSNLNPGESMQCFSIKNGVSRLHFSPQTTNPKDQCVDLTVIVSYVLETQPEITREKKMRFVTIPFGDGKTWVNNDDLTVGCQ